MSDTAVHAAATAEQHRHAGHGGAPHRPWVRFARHYAEMVIAMVLGMVVLGGAVGTLLLPFGVEVGDAPIAVMAGFMAVTMTIPMVAWMHFHHRMAVGRSVEMTLSMVVPTIAAIALHAAGVVDAHGVMVVQHVAMLPAMLAVMLWRREAYTC